MTLIRMPIINASDFAHDVRMNFLNNLRARLKRGSNVLPISHIICSNIVTTINAASRIAARITLYTYFVLTDSFSGSKKHFLSLSIHRKNVEKHKKIYRLERSVYCRLSANLGSKAKIGSKQSRQFDFL